MRVLVTGGAGFVGRAVVRRLAHEGHSIRVAVRRSSGAVASENVVVGNISGDTNWQEALGGVDVVIHLAARVHVMRDNAEGAKQFAVTNTAGTLQLAKSMVRAGVRRLVFVSTIKVNGEATEGRPFLADDVPAPADPYAVSKYDAERALLKIPDLEVVIIRPPLVYGPGVKGNLARFCRLAALRVPVPFGAIDNRRDLIGVANLADLLTVCASHRAATGQVFLASDGNALSTPQLYSMIAGSMGCTARLLRVSPVVLTTLGGWFGQGAEMQRLTSSLEVDIVKTRAVLGWCPPVSQSVGIAEMTSAFRGAR